ncbi:Beta-galactosidase 8 [Datura stramonium]|uniref:beta-galactosidase n=1 Tax=Datura stramonium TaxID=4076 RepID=A0ABS8SF06_DATST|nr:Beta-galactosidase 8 [Datura stramonium]
MLDSYSIHHPIATTDTPTVRFPSMRRGPLSDPRRGQSTVSPISKMWPDLIQKSKDGGLDVIETYVFWNIHEPVQNPSFIFLLAQNLELDKIDWKLENSIFEYDYKRYDFEGRKDLINFVKLVGKAGLYVHVRIGPYVCAEWNYGGFPLWLHFIPGIEFRTDNEPFKAEMRRFTAKIVDMIKQENLYTSRRAVILSQVSFSASMATSLNRGSAMGHVSTTRCPAPIINTCNGFYCDQFKQNSDKTPKMWTENWTGCFLCFLLVVLSLTDLWKTLLCCGSIFPAAGTFQNYYMVPASVYKTGSQCAAFLANIGTQSDAAVSFNGNSYHLPPWSVSILPDCKNVALNTAKINSVSTISTFVTHSSEADASGGSLSGWTSVNEPVGISSDNAFWDGSETVLHVESLGHVLHAFINGKLSGSGKGSSGNSKVSVILSPCAWRKQNRPVECDCGASGAGLRSSAIERFQKWLYCFVEAVDISGWIEKEKNWAYLMEVLHFRSQTALPTNQPLIWYKANFDAPAGDTPLSMDFTGMGKGEAWVNGQSIGRFWPTTLHQWWLY